MFAGCTVTSLVLSFAAHMIVILYDYCDLFCRTFIIKFVIFFIIKSITFFAEVSFDY